MRLPDSGGALQRPAARARVVLAPWLSSLLLQQACQSPSVPQSCPQPASRLICVRAVPLPRRAEPHPHRAVWHHQRRDWGDCQPAAGAVPIAGVAAGGQAQLRQRVFTAGIRPSNGDGLLEPGGRPHGAQDGCSPHAAPRPCKLAFLSSAVQEAMRRVVKGVGGFDHAQVSSQLVPQWAEHPGPAAAALVHCPGPCWRRCPQTSSPAALAGPVRPTPSARSPVPSLHAQWRSFSNQHIALTPARQFVDGDLVEQFLDLKWVPAHLLGLV